jgi:chromosome partitioning protein
MRSIAVMNQKGGVGKTTTAVNLAAALAESGRRVLLVDLDSQAHASLHLGVSQERGEDSVYRLLVGGATVSELKRPVSENLWLLPAHIDLAAAESELADLPGRERVLRTKLAAESAAFDYLLIDCPPSLGLLTINALVAVEEVFLPLQPHFLALHGLSKLLGTIDLVARRMNPRLRLSGVVLSMYEANTRLASEVAGDVEAFFAQPHPPECAWSGARACTTRIRRNIRLAEAPSFGQSVLAYAPTSPGAEDYRALAAEVIAMESATLLRRAA